MNTQTVPKPKFFPPLTVIALGIAFTLATLFILPTPGRADGPNRAKIVVQVDDDDAIVRDISFTAPVSGLKALEMTGLDVITYDAGWGIAVCSINGAGCPADNCFACDPDGKYWGYNYWDSSLNNWQGYAVGAPASSLNNGAVDGWRWGAWGANPMLPAPPITSASAALTWLNSQQQPDGGYGSAGAAVESMLSIGANRHQAAYWRPNGALNGPSLGSYMFARSAAYVNNPAASGKLAVAVAVSSSWPAGVLKPMSYYSPTTGAYGSSGSAPHAWAMLGTVALSQPVPPAAVDYLKNMAQPNGGWEWSPGWGTDTNSTALAIQALVAAGEPITSTVIVSAVNYLQAAQNSDGGFPYDPNSVWGTASDTNSTAYAVQALQAIKQNNLIGNANFDAFVLTNTKSISFLLGMQLPDGSFEWQPGGGSNLPATQQAVPALLGNHYPLKIRNAPIIIITTTASSTGGNLVYNAPGGFATQIEVPGSAVSETIELRYVPDVIPASGVQTGSVTLSGTFVFAGRSFVLEAFKNGSAQMPFIFNTPVTVTIKYLDTDMRDIKENSLRLFYWNGSAWSQDGITLVQTTPSENKLVAAIQHLSEFAVFGFEKEKICCSSPVVDKFVFNEFLFCLSKKSKSNGDIFFVIIFSAKIILFI